MFIVYHSHANPQKPSGERVVNVDRLQFNEEGKLKINGSSRSPQPMPSGANERQVKSQPGTSSEGP